MGSIRQCLARRDPRWRMERFLKRGPVGLALERCAVVRGRELWGALPPLRHDGGAGSKGLSRLSLTPPGKSSSWDILVMADLYPVLGSDTLVGRAECSSWPLGLRPHMRVNARRPAPFRATRSLPRVGRGALSTPIGLAGFLKGRLGGGRAPAPQNVVDLWKEGGSHIAGFTLARRVPRWQLGQCLERGPVGLGHRECAVDRERDSRGALPPLRHDCSWELAD
jgi:hypothetical protein